MLSAKPPQEAPSWTHTPEDVRKSAKEAIEQDKLLLNEVASLANSECNFESVSWKEFIIPGLI